MSYKLKKPYTEKQKFDFIVQHNHKHGLIIEETEEALYALEHWEKLVNGVIEDNTVEYESELNRLESERIAMLSLTASDVERAIYKAKGIDFEDILELTKDNPNIDSKALRIELKANYFYRGNSYVNTIGSLLGFSSEDLDYLFEHKELPVDNQEVNDDGMGI